MVLIYIAQKNVVVLYSLVLQARVYDPRVSTSRPRASSPARSPKSPGTSRLEEQLRSCDSSLKKNNLSEYTTLPFIPEPKLFCVRVILKKKKRVKILEETHSSINHFD